MYYVLYYNIFAVNRIVIFKKYNKLNLIGIATTVDLQLLGNGTFNCLVNHSLCVAVQKYIKCT